MIDDHDHYHVFISLACVSSETHDLQRVFRPRGGGELPHKGYISTCSAAPKGMVFLFFCIFGLI